MAEGAEKAPLKEVSLRFPDGAVGPAGGTEGVFDGNDEKSEPFSQLTRRDDYEPPIPEPRQSEIEEAARKGIDKNTGLTTQPKWLSVLKKRQGPWFFVRWACCNCLCNPRWTMTRAQWIWFANLICLVAHAWYAIAVFTEASNGKVEGAMQATIWRIKPMWNASVPDGYTSELVDNLKPIRIDILLGFLFIVSAAFHALAVALGPFDRWIWIYWRQLDLCFHWWRHLDYAITLPMCVMLVCLITHLREQNAIACLWMLTFSSVFGNFLTELWSRPHRNADRSYDMTRWLGDEAPIKAGLPWTRLTPEEVCQRALQQSRRRMNYVVRLIPNVIGIFPFVAVWVVILNHFFHTLGDLREDPTDDIYKRIPEFVPAAVLTTMLLMLLFFFPTWWWQWAQPQYYWVRCLASSPCSPALF